MNSEHLVLFCQKQRLQEHTNTSQAGAQPYDPFAALIYNYGYTAGSWSIANNYEYTKVPAKPYPPTFKPSTDIKPQLLNTMRVSNLTDFTVEIAAASPPGRRQLFITLTHGLSGPLITQIFNAADAALQPIKLALRLVYSLSYQPLPTEITTKASSTNSLGLAASDGNLVLTLLGVQWTLATDDAAITAAANKWLAAAKAAAAKAGLANEFVYLNYAAPGQDPIGGYGPANKANLRSVSQKYDPDQIFQKAVPTEVTLVMYGWDGSNGVCHLFETIRYSITLNVFDVLDCIDGPSVGILEWLIGW